MLLQIFAVALRPFGPGDLFLAIAMQASPCERPSRKARRVSCEWGEQWEFARTARTPLEITGLFTVSVLTLLGPNLHGPSGRPSSPSKFPSSRGGRAA